MDEKGNTQICQSPVSSVENLGGRDGSRPIYLIVVSGGMPGTMLRLQESGTTLGRSSGNTVQIYEITVSRHHATFSIDPEGRTRVTDLASTNGTFLNGRRLRPHVAARVEDGDRIQLGASVVLKFVRLDPHDERFQREMFERTVRDPLTNLYNRAYFLDQIGPLAERSAASGLGLAVMMLDIDHFKRINDTYGHEVGDLVLREVAGLLRDSTRSDDLIARYGGEEFVVALPVGAPDQASERAERIRLLLADRRIRTQVEELNVTASLGLTYSHPTRQRTPSSLITTADSALYQAKRNGRNRVVFRADDFSYSSNRTQSAEIDAITMTAAHR
jgi:diguanylate cyclase (GGDEF)-like protein